MWKHILIQGLYQMFWLFFFMYAAPVLFERYRITDHCTFVTQGPHEALPDPMFCTNELVSKLGLQVSAYGRRGRAVDDVFKQLRCNGHQLEKDAANS
jgi:hypothetical protein